MSIVLFAGLIWQVVDFLRELTQFSSNKSSIVTQLTAWAGGILLVAVAAHAAVTAALTFPGLDQPLGKLDAGSIILVGLMAASLASSLVDTKQAIDNSDSAAKPPLVGS
jgi:hypothetical protein